MSKLRRKFSENQIEFANEIQKQFTFEQLALCFYDNECEYCPKQHCCNGKASTKDCVANICRKFKETYELKEVEYKESDTEKRKEWPHKPCINYEDGCEEWAGCPCVYYNAESEGANDK